MNTKELLDFYYDGFARKEGWKEVIAEDFRFIGGDMKNRKPVTGKAGYLGVIERFSKLFTSMRVIDVFVDGDHAFVLAGYEYKFPGGKKIGGEVAEYWKIRDGKLAELTIYFDTLTFQQFTGK